MVERNRRKRLILLIVVAACVMKRLEEGNEGRCRKALEATRVN
jgi:hypothetical protein